MTDDDEVDEEMFQGTLTEVDLTDDHRTVSNGGTKPSDGLNGPTNEVDLTGDGAPNKVPKKGSTLGGDKSNSGVILPPPPPRKGSNLVDR